MNEEDRKAWEELQLPPSMRASSIIITASQQMAIRAADAELTQLRGLLNMDPGQLSREAMPMYAKRKPTVARDMVTLVLTELRRRASGEGREG